MTFSLMWGHPYPKRYLCKIAARFNTWKRRRFFSLYLEPVTEAEIRRLIMSLKSSAPGYDIRSSILNMSLPFICTPLTYISNLSLQEGVFPGELKIANVIPLFKSDDPELFNNYRPVSLLCTVSKVFERIMYNRLLSRWIQNSVFISIWLSETSFYIHGFDDFNG